MSPIAPGCGHYQWFLMVEIGIERTLVFIVIETDLDSSVDIPNPWAVLILLHIPFPAEISRTETAFLPQAHHILANSRGKACLKSYVADCGVFPGYEDDFILDIPVSLHLPFQIHQEQVILVERLPCDRALSPFCDLKTHVLPLATIGSQFHGSRKDRPTIRPDSGQSLFEIAGYSLRQPKTGQGYFTAKTGDGFPFHDQWGIRRHNLIIETDPGVEPAKSGMPPRFVIAMVSYHIIRYFQRHVHSLGLGVFRTDSNCSPIYSRRKFLRHLGPDPERLHLIFSDREILLKRGSLDICSLRIEACESGRRDPLACDGIGKPGIAYFHAINFFPGRPKANLEHVVLPFVRLAGKRVVAVVSYPFVRDVSGHPDWELPVLREYDIRIVREP